MLLPTSAAPQPETGQRQLIQDFLDESPRMNGARIKVSVHDHIARLEGEVLNLDQAEWAAAVAFITDQVYGAIQQLALQPSPIGTAELEEQANHIFGHAPALAGSRLSAIVSEDRSLVISGQAGSSDELRVARELASRIDGIRRIVVSASLNPLLPRRPAAIEAHLAMLQKDDPLIAHLPLEYRVDGGHLLIRGRVGSEDQRKRLLDQVMLAGIMSNDSRRIRIDPDLDLAGMSDKRYFPGDAKQVLELVLRADQRIDASRIRVDLEDGMLFLRGEIATERSRQAAHQNCRGLPGVLGVRNELAVTGSPALSVR